MNLILFTALCGLVTLPKIASAAAIPPHKPFHEATHVTDNGSDKGSEGELLYLLASDEGGVERINNEDLDIIPEGHSVDFDDSQNDTAPTQIHEISPGSPDLPKPVLHAVLDEIAFAVEDDPLVREIVKTSLKSGGIPVEVLTPGQKSNNANAILIEVFHLEDEGKNKSGDDQENGKNKAAVTDERLTLTGLFPSEENNNEVQPSSLPAGSLSRLVHLAGKDVENVGEGGQETRKRRSSGGNDTVAAQPAKVSSTTPGADTDLSTTIPTTVKNPVGFDKDLQLTTLSPKTPESNVPISKNYSSIILIMGSEEESDDEDDSDERKKRQVEVDGESSQEEDLDATSEVPDSDFDQTPLSPSGIIIHRQRRQAEDGSNIATLNEESLTVTILPSKVDHSTESVDGISSKSTTESNGGPFTITEEIISSTTESSKESVTSAQETISSTTESSEESVTTTEENSSSTTEIVSSTVDSISSTEVSNSTEEETTLPVDEDVSTTTLSLESEVATTTEGKLVTEDPAPPGKETATLAAGEDSSEESSEKTNENEDDSSEAKTVGHIDIVLDFYDI